MSLIAGNLGIIQRLLDEHDITWGVFAGAAAHVYGNRRPIKNIDIVVASGSLSNVSEIMKKAKRIAQFDGRRIMWSGINLCDDLTVRRAGATHTLTLDQPMKDHLRRMPLLGSKVMMLAPEDVLVHKLLLDRPADQGEKDLEDAEGIARRQTLDMAYLEERLRLTNGKSVVKPRLENFGIIL